MSNHQVPVGFGMNFPGGKILRHWLFLSVLLVYGVLLSFHLDDGLASGDAHGIVRTTHLLVENHRLEVSRPPGHPTTEFYIFGAAGWILKQGLGHKFDDKTYLGFQALVALATLAVFYDLLCRLGAERWRATLAAVCLAFSAQYFSNAIDGEEFDFALLFLLISIRLLIVSQDSASTWSRLFLSILCFALATGCRPEIVFAGVIFPVYCLFHPKLGWKDAIATLPIQAAAILLMWLPVIFIGLRAPYTAGMSLRESILGGGYRLMFQCFTPPVFILFCWILVRALFNCRARISDSFPNNFIFVASCLVAVIFFTVFFRHASKPAHVLVVVPFVLLLAMKQSDLLLFGLSAATLIGFFVNIDIFKDRQLVRPFLVPGSYFQATWQKPYYKLAYIRELPRQCADRPIVIIANAGPWDFEYQLARGSFFAREETLTNAIKPDLPAFIPRGHEGCILLPRDGAYETRVLEDWKNKGYSFKMDALLYRTLFARYNVTSPLTNSVSLGDVSFSLFSIK